MRFRNQVFVLFLSALFTVTGCNSPVYNQPEGNIADVMQQIKGGSSFWINNKTKLFANRFEWADKYYAVS